ncbi:MAG: exodeoxyribonuclease V subunit alpha [Synechococcus sp.]
MSSDLGTALTESLSRILPPELAATALAATTKETTVKSQTTVKIQTATVMTLSAALERGDLGLDLNSPPPEGIDDGLWPTGVVNCLTACGWLVAANALDESPKAPIVLDGHWLRWRRWHCHLHHCLDHLLNLGGSALPHALSDTQRDAACATALQAGLDDQQTKAVVAVLEHRLVLLTGGPGTGKTSTVVQMLAVALASNPTVRIQLAAPTGKAAARLQQAVTSGSRALNTDAMHQLSRLPSSTLHRLLDAQGENRFRHNRHRPLPLDLLVVDEVSMVDLLLMEALLDALPDHAQLLLVGDPDQLPPVGPGAVLQELNQPQHRQLLGPAAVELQTTYRNNGAIAALAHQLRQSNGEISKAQLRQLQPSDNVQWLEAERQSIPGLLQNQLINHQRRLRSLAVALRWHNDQPHPDDADLLLEELDAWIALSPVRQGPWGVERLNRIVLGDWSRQSVQHWPVGTPVLNRHNRPEQGLANGDIGVVVQQERDIRVLLPGQRILHPAQFTGAEPAFAMTIHKSQGSQYAEVALLLPPVRHPDPRLTYTGLTRARQKVLLITPQD